LEGWRKNSEISVGLAAEMTGLLFIANLVHHVTGAANYNKVWSLAKKEERRIPNIFRLLTF
jgi:hypothetical protein